MTKKITLTESQFEAIASIIESVQQFISVEDEPLLPELEEIFK